MKHFVKYALRVNIKAYVFSLLIQYSINSPNIIYCFILLSCMFREKTNMSLEERGQTPHEEKKICESGCTLKQQGTCHSGHLP